ncbi:YkgJ family cysteine cluster protein [bacterium]|nr:YkgJ family cysteine cluster protein [bacterium]
MRKRLQRLAESRGPAIRRETPQQELADTLYQRQWQRSLEILQRPEEPALNAIRLCHSVHEASEQAWTVSQQLRKARVDCKAGCAWCCHTPVRSTILDAIGAAAARLSQLIDYDLPHRDRPSLLSNFAACPLLVEGQCSVYPQRPVVCRGYHSLDVGACKQRFDSRNPSLEPPMDVDLYGLVGMPQLATQDVLKQLGIDCRPVVLGLAVVALQNDFEGMVADWLNGGAAFENAIVL